MFGFSYHFRISAELQAYPLLKFILIEDSVTAKGDVIFTTLLKNHDGKKDCQTHFFVFEGSFKTIQKQYPNCICYDYTRDLRNWMNQTPAELKTVISNLGEKCVVVVDSLAQVLYRYGMRETFRIFNELNNKKNVLQTLTVLHTDLLEVRDSVVQCFQHIASLYMEMLPEKRISYTLKRSSRKIKKMIEEYYIDDNGKLCTSPIKKPETIFKSASNFSLENLATFKIGLSETDKQSRDNLVLPYLPKDNDSSGGKGDSSGGNIHYTLDGVDDWDEEDPDDDLDI